MATEFGKNGLLFRPALPYKIRLIAPVDNNGTPLFQASLQSTILNKFYCRMLRRVRNRIPADGFVKKVKEVGFTDGMLTDYHQHLPSPILGFLGIPKAIVEAIVPIPAAPQSGSGSASGTTSPH